MTDSSFYATLVSEGFLGLVIECPAKVPSEVHLLGLGRWHVEHYTPEPDLCHHCSRWGHKEWRCQSATCCRYCASPHKSAQCLDKIKEGTKIPPCCRNCGGDHNAHSTLCTVRPRPQRKPATDEVSRSRLVFRQAPPPQTNAWATKPSFSAAAPHLSQPSYPTTGTSTTPAVFPPLPQRTATVPPVPPKIVPQPGVTQELPATNSTQQLMAVVSTLAAKVDNLSATVSGLSNEFAAFKNQQHTVCSGTSPVAPTPSSASGAQRGQGESDVCQHSLWDPPKKKNNAAGQCATATTPSSRMDTPTKPVKGATQQPWSPSGMAPASPASESKSPKADCDKDGEAKTPSPEPDQGHLMAAIQILMEQMSRLTQEVDSLKTQMQHHRDERMVGLIVHVVVWYAAAKGSFADAEALYDGLQHTIEGFIATARTLTVYQRRWQLNPADTESWDAMVTVAQHLMDLQQQERKKYWVSFLDKVCRTQSLWEVWHHVNSVWGKPR
ncbi:hypothetical protein E2C01_055575 [Portunus trituberculatus]|uniref:Nucleic-acid-binding protein from transposon X-element n=1 Tax=Portunus trituberculatus TaxID=210409 RepID=A0A5B7GRK7_PORTR|nr:hypothetical protein [Portunus trituberculatus]